MTAVPVLLAAAAAAAAASRPDVGPRLTRLLPGRRPVAAPRLLHGRRPVAAPRRAPGQDPVAPSSDPSAPPTSTALVRAACLLGAAAALLVVGGAAGVALGLLLAVAGPRAVAALQPDPSVLADEAVARDLPLALDLLSACLVGGSRLQDAAGVVGRSVGGPCGARLQQVGLALSLGAPAGQAWARLGGGDGTAGSVARALARSAEGGAPVAGTVARAAAAARSAAAATATRRARRAGVLAVAPLGVCFLPAFLLIGVVPAVIGLATPLLAGL